MKKVLNGIGITICFMGKLVLFAMSIIATFLMNCIGAIICAVASN